MKKAVATLAWVAGLCMAGAECEVYVNFIGLAVFLLSSIVIIKEFDHDRI